MSILPLAASAGRAGQDVDYVRITGWSLALIALILLLFMGINYVKRRWLAPDEPEGGGFTLADLRALRKQGKMTDEEFEKAKALILATYKRPEPLAVSTPRPAVTRPAIVDPQTPQQGGFDVLPPDIDKDS